MSRMSTVEGRRHKGGKEDGTDTVVISMSQSDTKTKSPDSSPEVVHLLCFDLGHLPRSWQFVILTTATFAFYLLYGYMQELIFKLEGFRPYGWYLTLVQFACYTIVGSIEIQFKEDKERKIPMKMYLLLAFLTVATMGLSNTSVGYLNYPTQVIFKCCKLIPVLIGGILIQGKRFSMYDICACLCMSIGLILFTLADSSIQPNFNLYGVTLISLALCADGVIGNVQEKTLKQHGASNTEMVLYSYGLGFVYILLGLTVTGGISPAFRFCLQYPVETYGYAMIFSLTGYLGVISPCVSVFQYPVETYGYAMIFSLTGYLGVNVVLTLVKSFGALVAVTVTTCRKAVTIILSFLFFTKPFTHQYVWSGLIVVLGIYLNLYSKNRQALDAAVDRALRRMGLRQRHWQAVSENIV